MRFAAIFLCSLLILPAFCSSALAEPDVSRAAQVNFGRDVWPIFEQHCVGCHGPEQQEGQLRLDTRATFKRGGVSGPLARAGQDHHSLLQQKITTSEVEERMPLDEDPLEAAEIEAIAQWLDQGAVWPEDVGVQVEVTEPHWSYVAPTLPELPPVAQRGWSHNPIDLFVLARLEKAGISPTEAAPPAIRLRRVYLDLIGVPPTVAEVEAFLAEPTTAAYEAVVDRLLASPRFGEKWARSWLDLARYSDSNGYQADQLRGLWAYRDWVIDAFNTDMPFDQFTIEQIGGDLLPNATLSQKIATGFHRTTTCNIEAGVDPEENRTNQIIDRVNTTATVWLGTTLECVQCHDHKYDPFTLEEYYQLYAYFNNTPLEVENTNKDGVRFDFYGPKMELPLSQKQEKKRAGIQTQLQRLREDLKKAETSALVGLSDWQRDLSSGKISPTKQLPAEEIKQLNNILTKKRKLRTAAEKEQLKESFLAIQKEVRLLRDRVARSKNALQKTDPKTTLVMVEMDKPRPTHIFERGVYQTPGERVEMGVPASLHPLPDGAEANRLGLARWLVDSGNPLASRVRVNHLWAEIFGVGLVASAEDFGLQGSAPSHPQLLDWLAATFMQEGWSTKRLLKLIVTSATYQQSSFVSAEGLDRDPDNRLMARGPRFRLPAEAIRDNALSISGLLEEKMGGPPVYPPQPPGVWYQTGRGEPVYKVAKGVDRHRRGVYVIWRRAAPYPSFVNFDAPDRTRCIVSRSRTNTPIQALTLLNDEAYVEMARSLAARILAEDLATDEEHIVHGFRMCVARSPKVEEVRILQRLLEEQRRRFKEIPEEAEQLTGDVYLPTGVQRPDNTEEWAAWLCVANTLLNLDETINKE